MIALAIALTILSQAAQDPGGYHGAKWGASLSEVRHVFPKAKMAEGWLQLHGPIAGLPALVTFHFVKDKLAGVVIDFEEAPGKTKDAVFMSVIEALGKRYSPSASYRQSRELEAGTGWDLDKTKIRIRMVDIPRHVELVYKSVELEASFDSLTDEQAKEL